jgi:hypothetical protein
MAIISRASVKPNFITGDHPTQAQFYDLFDSTVFQDSAAIYYAKDRGIVADGTTNNLTALNTLIQTVGTSGGGVIVLPAGTIVLYNTVAPTSYYDKPRVLIQYSNVWLKGAGKGATTLKFLGTGGTNPQTTWDLISDGGVNNVAVRQPGILIKSLVSETLDNIMISDLTLDGGCAATGDNSYPANPTTGDGWDISHKGIMFYGDSTTHTDNTYIFNVEVKSWRGEPIWSGGNTIGRIRIEGCKIHESNGSGISCSGQVYARNNEIFRCINGVESYPGPWRQWYIDNHIYNMNVHATKGNGIVYGGATDNTVFEVLGGHIYGNQIENCLESGILLIRQIQKTLVSHNYILDCGTGISIDMSSDGGYVHDLKVADNMIQLETKTGKTGIGFFSNTHSTEHIFFCAQPHHPLPYRGSERKILQHGLWLLFYQWFHYSKRQLF